MRNMALVFGALILSSGKAPAAGMPWARDWPSAQSAAKASGKPLMVDFSTEW